MAFIRDAKAPGGMVDLTPKTPIIIVGDLNLVGYAQQLKTMLSGEIVNVTPFGPAFKPDWDGSNFADLMPRHTDSPMTYTWRDDNIAFNPGRLDFMIYSDSVLRLGNRFVLFTPAMTADSLAAHDLQPQDVPTASDHLPVVSDFMLSGSTKVEIGNRH
jgi:exonuclease III